MYDQFIEFFKKNTGRIITAKGILEHTNIPRKTLYRYLDRSIEEGYIIKKSYGKYEVKQSPKMYLQVPFFERKPVPYNPDFLRSYTPNTSSFLGKERELLEQKTKDVEPMATLDYMKNRRAIENLLIDLSYTSSKMEGNTYSYLDTEVLIKYNEEAEGKKKEETQMILNHKNAIEYLIAGKNNFHLIKQEFCDLHTFLGRGLIHDTYLGTFRTNPVQIGGSRYSPPDIPAMIEGEFDLFTQKLRQIESPFEQSLFILVFVPYFQCFIDINKRTSRLGANIPLIARGLPPLSLLQVKERDYIDAILAIYELGDPSLIARVFTENYLLNMHRYM